jgi:hypothetical protein
MAYKNPADYADTLEDAVVVMRDRQVRLRGITRLHQPSPAEPLIVILIDELAALSYVNERDLAGGSTTPSVCCSPRAARSASRSLALSKIRARRPRRRVSSLRCGPRRRNGGESPGV